MGFLDSLLRKEVRKVISAAVDTVVDDALKDMKDNGSAASPAQTAACGEDGYCRGEQDLRNRIETVIAEEWQGYELKKDVPSSVAGAPEKARKTFTYGIYHDKVPVAMIQILNDKNEYKKLSVRLAQQACADSKIPYMNFMSYMANHREYISKRFQETIKG